MAIFVTVLTSFFSINASLAQEAKLPLFAWVGAADGAELVTTATPLPSHEPQRQWQEGLPLNDELQTQDLPSEDLLVDNWTSALSEWHTNEAQEEALKDGLYTVLILGTNGKHTDTLMIASVNLEKEKISLFSIPRDLAVKGQRINEYYADYGVDVLKEKLLEITGLEVDRYVQIDLQAFKDVVNLLGGVTITVDESIEDADYPDANGGYSPYAISKGTYEMNGEEALKYARSRKSTSDFDRASRQQNVLFAVKEKLEASLTLEGVGTLATLVKATLEQVTTDISALEAFTSYYEYHAYPLFTGFVLSNRNYLFSEINEAGAYILLPSAGDFSTIRKVIKTLVR